MATTDIAVFSSTTAQTAWAASGDNITADLRNNAGSTMYGRFNGGTPSSTIGEHDFALIPGASATVTAPQVYQILKVVWDSVTGGAGLSGQLFSSSTSVGGDDANLGDMKNRIASDLERTLTDVTHVTLGRTWDKEIEDAIFDSIKLYRSRPFWFLQEPNTLTITSSTTSGSEYVNDYTGLIRLDSLRITISGQRYSMREISFNEMESRFDGVTTQNQPYEYSRYGGRIRIYPVPDAAYTLTWSGIFEDSTLTGNEISNGWMTHGELLIRASAKLLLLRDYIKSYEDVPAAQQALENAEKALYREHVMRTTSKRIARRI
jgi:hypothetical protein